jgi:putative hemolysin
LLGADPAASKEEISDEELRRLIAANSSLSREERSLIDEVFDAGQRAISEVMLPRTEVSFLDAGMTISKAAKLAGDWPHSRYPVARGSHDDIVGFVHIRDLLLPSHRAGRAATVGDVTREVARLPGSKKVLAALSEMRREAQHLAIVEDEYGGTDGIVTLEDLIEEVIGDIRDEYDDISDAPTRLGSGQVEIEGRLNLDELSELTGLTLPSGPYETAAGFVLARLGRLAMLGDRVELDGWTLAVAELDGRRIARLRVIRHPPAEVTDPPAGTSVVGSDHATADPQPSSRPDGVSAGA